MASIHIRLPPLDYSHLLADLLSFHMDKNPSFPIFTYPSDRVPERLTEISLLEFGRAAHRVAHALRPARKGIDGEVVMLVANVDTILYHAVLAGLSVAGWVPFPVSPRNSAEAIVHMMNKTHCSHIVTLPHDHIGMIIEEVREKKADLVVYEIPSLHYTYPKLGKEASMDPFVPYPPPLKRPELDSPAIYIHSSGSTGLPKPIKHTHRIQIQWMAQPAFRQNAECSAPRRMATMALPSFHTFGLLSQLYLGLAWLTTSVVYPPRAEIDPRSHPVVPTSDNIIDCLTKIDCNVLYTVPQFLEQMATSEESIAVLKKLEFVRFGGGPLPVKAGDTLHAAEVKLASIYGGTEVGAPVAMPNAQDIADGDWAWFRFSEDLKIRWDPQGDGTYELQILSVEDRQMAVENLPDVKGYATSDLFEKHPTKDMWRIVGRTDDVIVLASGEKTVPGQMESIIGSSPIIQGAIMFGRERHQVGVLIEPRPGFAIDVTNEKAVAEFRNKIWPVIEEANKSSPAFSRIFKELILITSVGKPMSRAPKGTVQRKLTLKAYDPEINALYDTVEASSDARGLAPPSWTADAVKAWLLGHACAISSNDDLDSHGDLFSQGFDSLSATYLRNRILGALRQSSDPAIQKIATHITQNIIFENPTIELLSSYIAAVVDGNGIGQTTNLIEQHKQAINAIIEKYSVGLPRSQPIEPAVVLLTGTTGGLGSFLLSELLKLASVKRVFAFNRPSSNKSIEERQKSAFTDKGLSINLLDSDKLVYIEADASLEKCGLSAAQYEEITSSVTTIIHNAWRLDFNLAISSFEENIRASRNLVDLGLESVHKSNLRFLFTSSIGSAQSWDNSSGHFPEEVQLDPTAAIGAGYGEGKYVTERIIMKSGLHVTSLRIGQIAGGAGGSWATTDWFPLIVKSSIALGALPEAAGVVSWLREEEVTASILETAFANDVPPPALNIVNPCNTPWAEIIAFVRRSIIQRKGLGDDVLPIVPFGDWFAMLERKADNASEDDLAKMPAIKLLEFLRALARGDEAIRKLGNGVTEAAGMTNFSTTKAQMVSPTMANMRAIGEAEADAWVRYWISKGAF